MLLSNNICNRIPTTRVRFTRYEISNAAPAVRTNRKTRFIVFILQNLLIILYYV